MSISFIVAQCHIEGIAPLTQSRKYDHEVPKLEGESAGDYDVRNWRHHMHVRDGVVHVPQKAMHDALSSAAQYSKRKIVGQGAATWTQKFMSGIALLEDINLGIDASTVEHIVINAHATGNKRDAKRVPRCLPSMPRWSAKFDVHILDPIITEEIFYEMMEIASMFIGIGQYRPQLGGNNGRWKIIDINWQADRKPETSSLQRRRAA